MNGQLNESSIDGRLLQALVEHIKLPLLQVARQAELARLTRDYETSFSNIELTADNALRLLDSYLLSTRLASKTGQLELEPVSISALLTDVAHKLSRLAISEQCQLNVHLSGRYEPVIAHRAGLEAAILSLGHVFIEARSAQPTLSGQKLVTLGAHRGQNGIVAGIFSDSDTISNEMYHRAQELYGSARQALPELLAGSGAGVFVADSLLESMSARLRVAHHQTLSGLAATLMPSLQLSLV